MNNLTLARLGLRQCLESIPDLRVIDHIPDAWSDFPVATISFAGRGRGLTLTGTAFEGEFVVTLMLSAANPREALADLDVYICPLGDQSVQAAIRADANLGGSVDHAWLARVDNIGDRQLGSGSCAAADFHIRFVAR